MSELTGRIIDLLMINGMTQRDLAKAIDTTEATMSRYIKGDRIPKATQIVRMAEVLKCSTDYLLGVADENVGTGCEYCNADGKDWKYDSIPVSMGDFGDWQFTFAISDSRKTMEIDFEEVGHDPIMCTHINIEYCPYCGRKLKGRV